MKKRTLPLFRIFGWMLLIGWSQQICGQNAFRLTLDEVVALAQSDAPEALLTSPRWTAADRKSVV